MNLVKKGLRIPYRFFKMIVKFIYNIFTPIKDIVIFESIPDFCDNTKFVFDEMISRGLHKKYKFVWFTYEKAPENEKIYGVEYVVFGLKGNSKLVRKYLAQAKVLVCCNGFLQKRKRKQLAIFLAHGVPIKSTRKYYTIPKGIDYCVTTSEATIDVMSYEYNFPKEKFLPLGYPRNDAFKNLVKEIKPMLNTNCDKIIVWYPTFRQHKSGVAQTSKALPIIHDMEKAAKLNERLIEKNILIVLKPHFAQDVSYVKDLNLSNIKFIGDNFFKENNITSYEFVGKSDAVITDYSSIYYDFSLCDKPIAAVWEDIEEYKQNPGLIKDYEFFMKGAEKIYTLEDLLGFVDRVSCGKDVLSKERNEIKNLVNVSMDGKNSERVVDFIEKYL